MTDKTDNLIVLMKHAEDALERVVREQPGQEDSARPMRHLRLQSAVFHYEISREFVGLWILEPQGLAQQLGLRRMCQLLCEYYGLIASDATGEALRLMDERKGDPAGRSAQAERQHFQNEMEKQGWIAQCTEVAKGRSMPTQPDPTWLPALYRLAHDTVISAAQACLSFNKYLMTALGRAEAGVRH